jgi:hypothetical protein
LKAAGYKSGMRMDFRRVIKSGCVTTILVGVPVIGITLFGNFIDQCGDPGWGDCVPAPWTNFFIAVAISALAGLIVSLSQIAIAAIKSFCASERL